MRRPTLLLALASFCFSHAFAEAETSPELTPLEKAWRDTAFSLFRDANRAFIEQTGREARLGQALSLLQVQPKTDRNISEAASLLEEVRATDQNDNLGITARYYLGRLEHVHRTQPAPAAALPHYRELVRDHPQHPLAAQAAVKMGIIELYSPLPNEERNRLIRDYSALAQTFTDANGRRDLHLLIGEVILRFDLDKAAALDQFRAADAAGITRSTLQAEIWVKIGELARELEQYELARTYYQRFMELAVRDNRRRMIEERLAALPAAL